MSSVMQAGSLDSSLDIIMAYSGHSFDYAQRKPSWHGRSIFPFFMSGFASRNSNTNGSTNSRLVASSPPKDKTRNVNEKPVCTGPPSSYKPAPLIIASNQNNHNAKPKALLGGQIISPQAQEIIFDSVMKEPPFNFPSNNGTGNQLKADPSQYYLPLSPPPEHAKRKRGRIASRASIPERGVPSLFERKDVKLDADFFADFGCRVCSDVNSQKASLRSRPGVEADRDFDSDAEDFESDTE